MGRWLRTRQHTKGEEEVVLTLILVVSLLAILVRLGSAVAGAATRSATPGDYGNVPKGKRWSHYWKNNESSF